MRSGTLKIYILTIVLCITSLFLCAQSVERLKVRYTADSLYVITFNLETESDREEYRIALTAKRGDVQLNPLSATGAGIYYPIPEGKGYRILWSPSKEGLDPEGWGIRLRIYDPDPKITKVKRPISDYPLVIAASYVFMFTLLYIVNLIN